MISKYKLRVCQLEQISGWTNPAAFTACTAQTDQLSFIQLTTFQISLLPPEFNRSTNHTQQIMKKTVSLDGNARHLSNCCFLSLIETLVFYSFVTLQTAVCQIMIHVILSVSRLCLWKISAAQEASLALLKNRVAPNVAVVIMKLFVWMSEKLQANRPRASGAKELNPD